MVKAMLKHHCKYNPEPDDIQTPTRKVSFT